MQRGIGVCLHCLKDSFDLLSICFLIACVRSSVASHIQATVYFLIRTNSHSLSISVNIAALWMSSNVASAADVSAAIAELPFSSVSE